MTMATELTPQRTKILKLLEGAGATGLPKSRLGVRGDASGQRYLAALKELEAERQVGDLGAGRTSRYVLAVHFTPLELAYAALLRQALAADPRPPLALFSATRLKEKLPAGPIRNQGDAALGLLVREGELVAVRYANYQLYFARQLLPPVANQTTNAERAANDAPPALTREQVTTAYLQLARQTRFSHVRIAALHQIMGKPPLQELKQLLLEGCHQGWVMPSTGDLSLATAEEKAAGMELAGQLHLQILIQQQP